MEQKLLILIRIVMSASPKIVKIDLFQQSKKHQTSPRKKSALKSKMEQHQFSFSEDHPKTMPPQKSPPISKPVSPLVKKLFHPSPKKAKHQQPRKSSQGSAKNSIDKIRDKYRKMNPNYQKIDQTDKLFKRSIDKLKKSFFQNDRNSRQNTKKILRQIGKYAQRRSKSKPSFEPCRLQVQKPIPVQFYGFKDSPEQKVPSSKQKRQSIQKGTYLYFERAYELSISSNNKQINSIDYKSQHVQYVDKQSRKGQTFFQDHQEYQAAEKDTIGEIQIDTICQIFQFCDKYTESDTIAKEDLNKLIQQLERLYLVNISQQSQQKSLQDQQKNQSNFYHLLKELEEDLRVIFYRKQENNIYDTLYYLKQTNHLQLVCQNFYNIKGHLNL